jgi:hypothetical protein
VGSKFGRWKFSISSQRAGKQAIGWVGFGFRLGFAQQVLGYHLTVHADEVKAAEATDRIPVPGALPHEQAQSPLHWRVLGRGGGKGCYC